MLYDSESIRRFARVDLGEGTVPDESTILRFRHLLEEHALTSQIFATVRVLLEEHKRLLKAGMSVDATIIAAPSLRISLMSISCFGPKRSPVSVDADHGVRGAHGIGLVVLGGGGVGRREAVQ